MLEEGYAKVSNHCDGMLETGLLEFTMYAFFFFFSFGVSLHFFQEGVSSAQRLVYTW